MHTYINTYIVSMQSMHLDFINIVIVYPFYSFLLFYSADFVIKYINSYSPTNKGFIKILLYKLL